MVAGSRKTAGIRIGLPAVEKPEILFLRRTAAAPAAATRATFATCAPRRSG
jgi:hypothetical protein